MSNTFASKRIPSYFFVLTQRLRVLAGSKLRRTITQINTRETFPGGNKQLLTITRDVVLFIAIYLYFTGWVYANFFFKHFGISLTSLDINYLYFFIYSYPVLSDNGWFFMGVGLLITILLLVRKLSGRQWGSFALLPIFVGLFPMLFNVAQKTGEAEAINLRQFKNIKTINLELKDKSDSLENNKINLTTNFLAANNDGELVLITETKDRFYVLHQPFDTLNPSDLIIIGYVYQIQKQDIRISKINIQP